MQLQLERERDNQCELSSALLHIRTTRLRLLLRYVLFIVVRLQKLVENENIDMKCPMCVLFIITLLSVEC